MTDTIRRYYSGYWQLESDLVVFDQVWVDRKTGKKNRSSIRPADPANTNPEYGAPRDQDIFERLGLDMFEKIDINECVVARGLEMAHIYALLGHVF